MTTLPELIAAHRNGRSHRQLAIDGGGIPGPMRWEQISRQQPAYRPNREAIAGIARALGVTEDEVRAVVPQAAPPDAPEED